MSYFCLLLHYKQSTCLPRHALVIVVPVQQLLADPMTPEAHWTAPDNVIKKMLLCNPAKHRDQRGEKGGRDAVKAAEGKLKPFCPLTGYG